MKLEIPDNIIDMAFQAMNENFNILNPTVYTKHKITDEKFLEHVREYVQSDTKMDIVLFSSKSGAEEHTDIHLKHLDTFTYIIPVIVPEGDSFIVHSKGKDKLVYAEPIKINHQEPHSLSVSNDSGCVVLMASKTIRSL